MAASQVYWTSLIGEVATFQEFTLNDASVLNTEVASFQGSTLEGFTVRALFSLQSAATGGQGNLRGARKQMHISICCTVAGWVTIVLGVATIVGITVGLSLGSNNTNTTAEMLL